jgi:hypothetical protein
MRRKTPVHFGFFASYASKTTDYAENESLAHFSATIESTQKHGTGL